MKANFGCGYSFEGDVRLDVKRSVSTNVVADMQYLPFRDNVFSESVCISVLEHIPDWRLALKEICRVTSKLVRLEVPVNSSFKLDFFRVLLPTPKNINLIRQHRIRRLEHLWQFKPSNLTKIIEAENYRSYHYKKVQWYSGMISRCWFILGVKK